MRCVPHSSSRPLLLMLACALLADHASAQGFSFLGGANYTWMRDPLGVDHGPKAGHSVSGAGYSLEVDHEPGHSGPFGLCYGLAFSQRSVGYQFDETRTGYPASALNDGSDRGTRSMQCRVIELPVMLAYRGRQGLRLEGGLYVSRLLSAVDLKKGTRLVDNMSEMDLHERIDRTASLAPWEVGGIVGVLIEGPRHFHMSIRYKKGFTNLDRAIGSSPSYTDQLQVCVVYAFHTAP